MYFNDSILRLNTTFAIWMFSGEIKLKRANVMPDSTMPPRQIHSDIADKVPPVVQDYELSLL